MVWTEEGWSILILIVIICLYTTMVLRNKDPLIGLTAIWVFMAIYAKCLNYTINIICIVNSVVIGLLSLYSIK